MLQLLVMDSAGSESSVAVSGSSLGVTTLVKARSGLVSVFHYPGRKVDSSLGL